MLILRVLANKKGAPVFVWAPFPVYAVCNFNGCRCRLSGFIRGSFSRFVLASSSLFVAFKVWRSGTLSLFFHHSFEALSEFFRSSIGVRGTSWRLLAAALPIPAGLRGVSCVKCRRLYYTAVLYLPIFCSSSTGRIESACLAGRPAVCR